MYSSWDLNVVEKDGVVNITLIHHSTPPEIRTATLWHVGGDRSSALECANRVMKSFIDQGRTKFSLEIV